MQDVRKAVNKLAMPIQNLIDALYENTGAEFQVRATKKGIKLEMKMLLTKEKGE